MSPETNTIVLEEVDFSFIQKKKMKLWLKIVLSVLLALVVIITGVFGVSIYVGLKLTTPTREDIIHNPGDYNMIFENINFTSKKDNLLLSGWWIPTVSASKNTTIIFSHGYGNNRAMNSINVLELAKVFSQIGYDVLMFDYRASGLSEGKRCTDGEYEKFDMLAAIDYAVKMRKANDVHLIGWSMGASIAINAAAESNYVSAVVADSPFANLKDYLEENLPYWSNLPDYPFTNIIMGVLPRVLGIHPQNVDCVSSASKLSVRALFLIHSKDDQAIPYRNSQLIWNAVTDKSKDQIWLPSNSKHVRTYQDQKTEYTNKVLDFFNKN